MREIEFENEIRNTLESILENNTEFKILYNKRFSDICIVKNGNNEKLFFLEIKFYRKKCGRIHLGCKNGKGFQPEILKNIIEYFENNLRWILGNENGEYVFATNSEIREKLSGQRISNKHNNIQKRIFESKISKEDLRLKLREWIFSNNF
jgi:hypothetical protein